MPSEFAQQQPGGGGGGTQDAGNGGGNTGGDPGSSSGSDPGWGSTPSPITHHDGGITQMQPDAATPTPVVPGEDAGAPPAGDDAGTPVTPDAGTTTTTDSGTPPSTLLTTCVSSINSLRAQNGLSPYTESSTLETFAAAAAASDAKSGNLDGYFNGNGGNNVSSAEDEFDGAQVDTGASALDVFNQGLSDEEQGYLNGAGNLLSQQYTQVGCGVAQASDGNYWITIEYH
jgi:uncharacterized protein YkwD